MIASAAGSGSPSYPDCGFAPGSAAYVDIDEVFLELRAEADAARTLRERHH